MKDYWNSFTPYQDLGKTERHLVIIFIILNWLCIWMMHYLAVLFLHLHPCAFKKIHWVHLDFGNGQNGLYGLKGNPALAGTALDDAIFGKLLLPAANSPRSVDLWPIFNTGVPNLTPYQLQQAKLEIRLQQENLLSIIFCPMAVICFG